MTAPAALARVARSAGAAGRSAIRPTTVRGAAVEAAWWSAHYASYPLGLVRERTRPAAPRTRLSDLSPAQRSLVVGDVEAAGTPIVLIHGLLDNRGIFTVLRRQLRRSGFGRVECCNYSVRTTDIRVAARRLGDAVERLCEETGYDRVHLVGHSMGGLIARYYVQRLGGDARVHTVVTLGTPHSGTAMAHLLPVPVCRQLRPGSALLAELAQPSDGCTTRFLAVYSDLDELVVPQRSGRIDHPDLQVRNVLVRGVGHMSLPINGRVRREISSTLAHLETVSEEAQPLAA